MSVSVDFLKRATALGLQSSSLPEWLDEVESLRQQLETERKRGLLLRGALAEYATDESPDGWTAIQALAATDQAFDEMNVLAVQQMEALKEAERQRDELWTALENCRLLAARHHTEEWASHILRFCSDVGVTGSPLRTTAARKDQT